MKLTAIIIVALVVLTIAIDVALVLIFGGQATISTVLYESSKQYPVIPFAFGFVCGHVFWVNK